MTNYCTLCHKTSNLVLDKDKPIDVATELGKKIIYLKCPTCHTTRQFYVTLDMFEIIWREAHGAN